MQNKKCLWKLSSKTSSKEKKGKKILIAFEGENLSKPWMKHSLQTFLENQSSRLEEICWKYKQNHFPRFLQYLLREFLDKFGPQPLPVNQRPFLVISLLIYSFLYFPRNDSFLQNKLIAAFKKKKKG